MRCLIPSVCLSGAPFSAPSIVLSPGSFHPELRIRFVKISLSPRHFARYKDVLLLLAKYGRSDLVKDAPVVDDPLDYGPPPPVPPAAKELAEDLEKLGPTFVKLGQLIS